MIFPKLGKTVQFWYTFGTLFADKALYSVHPERSCLVYLFGVVLGEETRDLRPCVYMS